MASYGKRPDRGNALYVNYRDFHGKTQKFKVANVEQAKRWKATYDQLEVEWRAGNNVPDPRDAKVIEREKVRSGMTMAVLAEKWYGQYNPGAQATRDKHHTHMRAWIIPYLGDEAAVELRPEHISRLMATMADRRKSKWTQVGVRSTINLILEYAVRNGYLDKNVCAEVGKPKGYDKAAREARPFTREQLPVLFDGIGAVGGERDRLMVRLWAATGVRPSELVSLEKRHVLFDRNAIVVWSPKTHTRRAVPLVQSLKVELEAHCAGLQPGDLLFTSDRGRRINYRNWTKRVWRPAVEQVGLTDHVPYDLRHTFASWLISKGADVLKVQQAMGHSTPRQTLGTYGHLFDGHMDELRVLLDSDDLEKEPLV